MKTGNWTTQNRTNGKGWLRGYYRETGSGYFRNAGTDNGRHPWDVRTFIYNLRYHPNMFRFESKQYVLDGNRHLTCHTDRDGLSFHSVHWNSR